MKFHTYFKKATANDKHWIVPYGSWTSYDRGDSIRVKIISSNNESRAIFVNRISPVKKIGSSVKEIDSSADK